VAAYQRETKFEAVELHDAQPGWYVRIILPHGERVLTSRFETEFSAKEWIATKAADWLKKYRGGRYWLDLHLEDGRQGLREAQMTITGQQVKAARMLLGWSQFKLAAEIRISETTIGHFEIGRRWPSARIVSAIQRTLEIAGVEFVDGEPGVTLKAKP
jgi:DNA-binding XRE family transcriptional regulator